MSDNDEGDDSRSGGLISCPLLSVSFMAVRQATEFVNNIRKNYDRLLDKLEFNLGDRNVIFNPVEHDRLLIDDVSFIRSRRYFWTIEALDTFSSTIKTSIAIYDQFMDLLDKTSPRLHERQNLEPSEEQILRNEKIASKEFRGLLERIQAIKERTVTLRDGVCIYFFWVWKLD